MRWLFFILAVTLALSGCVGGKSIVWQEPGIDLVWPAPPDPPRVRYLRSITGPADFREEGKSQGALRWLLGEDEQGWPLLTPYAVAHDDFGCLWVADSGARMLYRFDLNRGKVDYVQESNGVRLVTPGGLAVDNLNKRVFVADAELARILVFDLKGQLQSQWVPPEGFKRPAGLALDNAGRLYVADVMAGRIVVFDSAGKVVERRGSGLNADGLFNRPLTVAVGPQGELLVNESMAFHIEVQDARGGVLGTIGRLGDGPGMFARPRGLAVSPQGHVFVSDAAFDNIQVFDLTGRLLMYFGSTGEGAGQFNLPAGLSFDSNGRLFAADSYNHRIQIFQFMPVGSQ